MSLLGLLLCGLGWGYAVHKDNQKFANMRADAVRQSGRGVLESVDDKSITNKYYREVKGYFNERYNYYINNKDYIMKNTNIDAQIERLSRMSHDFKEKYSLEQIQQSYAGWLSYEDMCAKYAPDYVKYAEGIHASRCPYSPETFASIARALARKELYKQRFKPAHMATMSSPINVSGLYFSNSGFGVAMDYPTEYSYESLDRENSFKYLTEFGLNSGLYGSIYYAKNNE